MLFFNIKLSNVKLIAVYTAVLTGVLLLALILFVKIGEGRKPEVEIDEDFSSPASYITSFGATVDETALRVDEVTVPLEFGEVYTSYNNLQKSQGFDLERYKGKTLKRYTYPVTNYPDKSQSVFAEVLVYEGIIVAADIYSTDADGFMSALK